MQRLEPDRALVRRRFVERLTGPCNAMSRPVDIERGPRSGTTRPEGIDRAPKDSPRVDRLAP